MGLYNFKERFVPFILDGRKQHTIRAVRANPDKPGNTLHLYTGLRTKKAKLLMRVPCVKIEEIEFRRDSIIPPGRPSWMRFRIIINDALLHYDEVEAFAKRDGFSSFSEMIVFWKEAERTFPWRGHIIHWRFDNTAKARL